MSKLSKEAITKKGLDYLKSADKASCLVCEDGSVFLPENERYATSHARSLMAKGGSGKVETVKAGKAKAESKPEAPKAEEAKEETPAEEAPKSEPKSKKTKK